MIGKEFSWTEKKNNNHYSLCMKKACHLVTRCVLFALVIELSVLRFSIPQSFVNVLSKLLTGRAWREGSSFAWRYNKACRYLTKRKTQSWTKWLLIPFSRSRSPCSSYLLTGCWLFLYCFTSEIDVSGTLYKVQIFLMFQYEKLRMHW